MRILHILNHTVRLNGHVHAAVDLACAQRRLGHDVAICSGGGSFDELLTRERVETILIDQRRKPATLAKAVLELGRATRQRRIDVVHAHMMTSALLAWPVCRSAGIPLVTTVHNEFKKSAILMGVGHQVIAVSNAVATSMIKRGIPAHRMNVVLNGTIGAARFDKMDRTPVRLASPAIVYVGGLHPRKGILDLLAAFEIVHRQHPEAHLTIVGEGPHEAEYRAVAATIGDAVTFTGPQENPRSFLLGADIFVLPSHSDPAPLVISEAREAGCAIVATEVDGIPELLEYGNAGILVPAKAPIQLAAALTALVADRDELAHWRANSQINIDKMAISRVAEDTIKIYQNAFA